MDKLLESQLSKVSIVSIFTNGVRFVDKFINSILKTDFPDYEVIIIDNASNDGTTQKLANYNHPRLRIVRKENKEPITNNLNDGIRLSRGKYLVHVDSDVVFPECDWLIQLVKAVEKHPNAAGANPLILFPDAKTIQSLGLFQSQLHPGWLLYKCGQRADLLKINSPFEVWGLHGAVALWKREALIQAGGFDEGFFPIWVEDGDMSWRLKLMGYSFLAVPTAKAIHFVGGSTPTLGHRFVIKKNTVRAILKNMSALHILVYFPAWLVAEVYISLKRTNGKDLIQLLRALAWNAKRTRNTFMARTQVRRTRKTSDASALKPVLPISELLKAF